MFCKIDVLKNFSKFTRKNLYWSCFLIKLQVSRPETSAQVFSCEFCTVFQKTIFMEHLWMTASADSSIPTKVLSADHPFSFFLHIFFSFIIDNCNYGSLFRKGIKMKIFLLFIRIYPKIT